MTLVRAALVIPAEGLAYGEVSAANDLAQSWFDEVARWLDRELGRTIDVDYRDVHSRLSHRQLATSGDGRVVLLDAQDQGLHEDALWGTVFPEAGFPLGPHRRQWAIVIGGGGWAGGRFDRAQDIGMAAVGDWGLYFLLTGTPDPGCLAHYDATFCSPGTPQNRVHPAWALGHEVLHSFGLTEEFGFDIHSQGHYIGLGDQLSPNQRDWMLEANAEFLG